MTDLPPTSAAKSPFRLEFPASEEKAEPEHLAQLAEEHFQDHCQRVWRRTDHIFVGLMALQWLAGIGVALWITPRTWIGATSSVHLHVLAAIYLGGAIAVFPILLVFLRPGQAVTRHVIGVSQMLFSALLIHLTGGRIETHFHVFGSLAFLAFYRDWRVLVTATIVVSVDHFLRGTYWPQSVFGTITPDPFRWMEHAGWVLFEDVFLWIMCYQSILGMRHIARRQAELELTNERIELAVEERTGELTQTNEALQAEISERKRAADALARTSALLEILMKNTTDCIYFKDRESRFVSYSQTFIKSCRLSDPDGLRGKTDFDFYTEEHARPAFEDEQKIIQTGKSTVLNLEEKETHADGRVTWALTSKMPWHDKEGNIIGTWGISKDITERKKAERQLNVQYAISRVLAEAATVEQAAPQILQVVCENLGWDAGGLWLLDRPAAVLRCDEMWGVPGLGVEKFMTSSRQMTFARGIGLPGRVWSNGQPAWIRDVVEDTNFPRAPIAGQAGLHGAFAFPILLGSEVGAVVELFSREVREPDESLLLIVNALARQIGQFFQRRRLEDYLVQSQKMETVGKLAGGVAHEFNSIITAIIGQSELLISDLAKDSPPAKSAIEIRQAADRAATLTRQLLAYGRKQIMQPEVLDLNSLLTGMESMLLHLMGADVDVRIIPAAGLKEVNADAGQIEQVILNIAINAREAMPHGGKLTLETAVVSFCEEKAVPYPELKPGDYVMLAVTDTGTGMSPEVRARVFDPFFSTKGVGEGPGLGLATCYGIIKQSGGHINIYSEEARGTSIKIYLPKTNKTPHVPSQAPAPVALPRGTETVLLVEDDPALREMSSTFLSRLGYKVSVAANGMEALRLFEEPGGKSLDLLFTDMVMPELDGKALSERILELYPGVKILFTSAYTENAIVHQGMLSPGVALLQKPFTPSAMAHKVREVLDRS